MFRYKLNFCWFLHWIWWKHVGLSEFFYLFNLIKSKSSHKARAENRSRIKPTGKEATGPLFMLANVPIFCAIKPLWETQYRPTSEVQFELSKVINYIGPILTKINIARQLLMQTPLPNFIEIHSIVLDTKHANMGMDGRIWPKFYTCIEKRMSSI
jgi:hypothetical protein